ncbi:MAG: nicotinate (nicotinamide) nucleotide adenylyltransferase [Sulfurospirillum sp.]|nr:nicotinate (nicotinamide) nucleotide adenylyltransferase [Sulfurospirillum sp.]
MDIAVFGGSFDPPHVGHVKIIKEAIKTLEVEKIFIVPTYLNPFKTKSYADAQTRFEWLHVIFKPYKNVEILDYEILQNKKVPTMETIEYLDSIYDLDKIYLIMGADNFLHVSSWYRYEALKERVIFVIASRDNIDIPKNLKKLSINATISSSKLRENMNIAFIPKNIENEIKMHYARKKMEERIGRIVAILDEKKAENIQVFDMSKKDYFVEQVVLATTLGDKHGFALLDHLKTQLKEQGENFLGIDAEGEWVVVDMGDILIHLMTPAYRSRYNLEDFLAHRDEEMRKAMPTE